MVMQEQTRGRRKKIGGRLGRNEGEVRWRGVWGRSNRLLACGQVARAVGQTHKSSRWLKASHDSSLSLESRGAGTSDSLMPRLPVKEITRRGEGMKKTRRDETRHGRRKRIRRQSRVGGRRLIFAADERVKWVVGGSQFKFAASGGRGRCNDCRGDSLQIVEPMGNNRGARGDSGLLTVSEPGSVYGDR